MNTKFLQIIWILSRLRYQLETVQTFSKPGFGDRGNSLHSLGFLNNQRSPRVHVALGLSDFGTGLRGPCLAKPVRNASRPGGKNDQVARGPAVLWIPLGKGLHLWTDEVFSFSRSQYATDYRVVTHNTSAGNVTIEKVRVFVRSLNDKSYNTNNASELKEHTWCLSFSQQDWRLGFELHSLGFSLGRLPSLGCPFHWIETNVPFLKKKNCVTSLLFFWNINNRWFNLPLHIEFVLGI